MLSSHTTLTKTDAFLETDVDDEIVLMNLQDGAFASLNETGCACWQLISEGATLATITSRLALQYDVDPQTCQAGVHAFIEQLVQNSIVRVQQI